MGLFCDREDPLLDDLSAVRSPEIDPVDIAMIEPEGPVMDVVLVGGQASQTRVRQDISEDRIIRGLG